MTPENGLVTHTQKVKRLAAKAFFEKELEEMVPIACRSELVEGQ